jgi:hypothetical protein
MIDALVVAGSTPSEKDVLLEYTGAKKKALIDIAGREMIRYVVEAIGGSSRIGNIVVVGIDPEDGVEFCFPVELVKARGNIEENIMAGLERLLSINPSLEVFLLSSADLPLLTTEAIDYFIDASLSSGAEFCYPVVEKSVMEGSFPGSGRSFRPFREGSFAGGDIFVINLSLLDANRELFREAFEHRKSALRMVKLLGFSMLIKFLTKRLTLSELERVAGNALRCRGKVIISPYPELGMDVDKPHQLEMVRAIIEARQRT